MIDTHLHLLPGVDDGPRDLAQAQALAALLAEEGVEGAVVTPHLNHPAWPDVTPETLADTFEAVQAHFEMFFPVYPGAEMHVNWELYERLSSGDVSSVVTLAGSRYVLLEFPFLPVGPDPEAVVHEAILCGFVPILAHPERVPKFSENESLVRGLVRVGAYLQLSASALVGHLGRAVRKRCEGWLRDGLVALVASDAHDPKVRPPYLAAAFQRVSSSLSREVAELLFVENPARIVRNDALRAMEGVL